MASKEEEIMLFKIMEMKSCEILRLKSNLDFCLVIS